MSDNWVKDINEMHEKYGVPAVVKNLSVESLQKLLEFRYSFLEEEMTELDSALTDNDPEEIVDALIDLCVVAVGTLDVFGVDASKAWDEVLKANMSKEVGVNPTRPNPLGLPDLVKPEGWQPPSHTGNYGILPKVFED